MVTLNGLFDFSRSINPAFLIPSQSLPQRLQSVIKITLPLLNANASARSAVSYLFLAVHAKDLAIESFDLLNGKKGWDESKDQMLKSARAASLLALSIWHPYLYLISSEIFVLLNSILYPGEENLFSHLAKLSLQSLYLVSLLGESPVWKGVLQKAQWACITEEGKSGLEDEQEFRAAAPGFFITQQVLDYIGQIPLLLRNLPDLKQLNPIVSLLVVAGRIYQALNKKSDFLRFIPQVSNLDKLRKFADLQDLLFKLTKEDLLEEAAPLFSNMVGVMNLAILGFDLFSTFRKESSTTNYKIGALDKPVKMEEVVGCKEAKKTLSILIDQIKNRDNYTKLGPLQTLKGILFYGPPGTGKSMLTKAFATEIGASKFIEQPGSSFVDKYVGTGPSSVRSLFRQVKVLAKENPNELIVVFIDEINSIAGKREAGADSGTQEFNRTTEAFLVELDNLPKNVIVVGATNTSPLELDTAFTRSGRFDKHIEFKLPTLDERKSMIALHATKYKVDAEAAAKFASRTENWNYADLENWIKQAADFAGYKQHDTIREDSLEEANDSIRKQKSGAAEKLTYFV